eukprot:1159932-Pelagomonas_calceolata.AAC.8
MGVYGEVGGQVRTGARPVAEGALELGRNLRCCFLLIQSEASKEDVPFAARRFKPMPLALALCCNRLQFMCRTACHYLRRHGPDQAARRCCTFVSFLIASVISVGQLFCPTKPSTCASSKARQELQGISLCKQQGTMKVAYLYNALACMSAQLGNVREARFWFNGKDFAGGGSVALSSAVLCKAGVACYCAVFALHWTLFDAASA